MSDYAGSQPDLGDSEAGESALSFQYSDLAAEIGGFLGYGTDDTLWSDAQTNEINRYIQSGLRQFYYPPAIPGIEAGYEWSFLKPTDTMTLSVGEGVYDMPDDFGRILGELHFEASVHNSPILVVSESRIQYLLQQSDQTGIPNYAAVRYKSSNGITGQRQEIVFWPVPDAAYTLTYRYEAFAGAIDRLVLRYPLGGMKHSELILESCLAIAEQRANDEKGLHSENFIRLLATGIAQDRKNSGRFYGSMASMSAETPTRERCRGSNYEITYKGDVW